MYTVPVCIPEGASLVVRAHVINNIPDVDTLGICISSWPRQVYQAETRERTDHRETKEVGGVDDRCQREF